VNTIRFEIRIDDSAREKELKDDLNKLPDMMRPQGLRGFSDAVIAMERQKALATLRDLNEAELHKAFATLRETITSQYEPAEIPSDVSAHFNVW